jgi:deoxyribonuclease V
MPIMLEAFNKLEEKPDVVFIKGHGITHPRLGLASHFSLIAGVPTIGIAEQLLDGEIRGENIVINGKIVGKLLTSKQGSRPLYVSPGNLISVKSAFELAEKFIKQPHKFPEPLHIAGKYGKRMRKELFSSA